MAGEASVWVTASTLPASRRACPFHTCASLTSALTCLYRHFLGVEHGSVERKRRARDRHCIRNRQSDLDGRRRGRDGHKRTYDYWKRKSRVAASRDVGT